MENDVRSKWKFFKSQSSNTHIGKIDFKIKTVRRDKAGHFIMINGLIQEENITTINMETPRHIRLIMVTIIKGESGNRCPTEVEKEQSIEYETYAYVDKTVP